jgi:DNA-binding transcriptional MerR regulator
MASKRGLSTDEKKKRMLEFFHEKQDFFQLKDVEKICSTEKGITVNTIKDILTNLVDDGHVDSEKIGTSVYYWCLPSKALKNRKETVANIEKETDFETSKNAQIKAKLEKFKAAEDDEEKRQQLQEECVKLEADKQKLLKELEMYKENDPDLYNALKLGIVTSKKACNRWVENIFSLKSWLKNKFRIDESVIDKQFEIPSDLDYIS